MALVAGHFIKESRMGDLLPMFVTVFLAEFGDNPGLRTYLSQP